ncbi:MAG TPA: M67 family metallopeptidase [Rhizomicrobium sp.]|nr:M67 family metallopeptidase [Rhizomicrobium sp.]
MRLLLPEALRVRIESEARTSFPRECCGLIEGLREGDVARAFTLHPARNIAPDADRFEIAPDDHFAALRRAREHGHALIGCYHSHPNGEAKPSAHDLAGAGEEGFLWLIASLDAKAPVRLAAFVYSAAVFLPAEIICAVGADLVTSSGKARN